MAGCAVTRVTPGAHSFGHLLFAWEICTHATFGENPQFAVPSHLR